MSTLCAGASFGSDIGRFTEYPSETPRYERYRLMDMRRPSENGVIFVSIVQITRRVTLIRTGDHPSENATRPLHKYRQERVQLSA